MPAPDETIVKTTNQARAGEAGPSVRRVLIIGTAAVAVAFAVLWFGWFG